MTENNNTDEPPKLRKISREDLRQVFEKHEIWVENGCHDFHTGRAKLMNYDLRDHSLANINLQKALLQGTCFKDKSLIGANFFGADLHVADFRGANLYYADFREADLLKADFRGAELVYTNFENSNVTEVKFNSKGKYHGIRVETSYGSPRFKRFAKDQAWLEEFIATRNTKFEKFWAFIWRATSGYGRDIWRWIIVSALLALVFAVIYYSMYLNMSPAPFKINNLPSSGSDPLTFLSILYYSVVTFTTLGFGDIVPTHPIAAIFVMVEVIIGYVMLGGLISIFATLLARRA